MKKTVSITREGKTDLEKELSSLKAERPAIAERIAAARAFGDLSENQEYSDARDYQKTVENRILEIEEILKDAKVIVTKKGGSVSLGSTVKVSLGGRKFTYTLVGPVEADPSSGRISNESPIGKALLGRKAGDSYELPNGNKGKILEVA